MTLSYEETNLSKKISRKNLRISENADQSNIPCSAGPEPK